MDSLLFNSLFAFIASCLCISTLKPISPKLGLIDTPCSRKHHTGNIPLIGGLAILCVMVLFYLLSPINQLTSIYTLSITSVALLGIADDKNEIPAKLRLLGQLLIAILAVTSSGLSYQSLGNLLGYGEIQLESGAILFTVIAIVGTINAFNMLDGIDGLCSGIAVTVLSFILMTNLDANIHSSINLIVLIFCLLAYMAFNLQLLGKKVDKIFMGDSGSMLIGFSVAWALIESTQAPNSSLNPAIAIWVLALPLMDMGSLMIRRSLAGRSPFLADRNHLHHILTRSGLSQHQALFIMLALSCLSMAIGYSLSKLGVSDAQLFWLWIASFIVYNLIMINGKTISRQLRHFRK